MRAAIFVVLLPLSICFESSIVTSWPRRFNLLPSFSSRPRTWPALGGRERAGYRIWAPRVRAGVSRGSGSGASSTRMVESPIAGATVSDDGFVVFLSYMASGRYFEQDMYIPVVINSEDTTVVKSPEALTFLQMLQGIDMATPLLPPDALQKAYQGLYGDVGSVALTEVHMYPPINPWLGPREVSGIGSKVDGTASFSAGEARPLNAVPSAKREAMILQRAPDLVKALKHLNVIVDENRAIDLLRTFSSAEGDLDRSAFSEALAAARMPVNAAVKPPGSQASFTLVAVTDDSIGKELNVSAFVALSLHLRHKVPIVIKGGRRAPGDPQEVELNAAAWDAHAFDAADAGSLYPQWRSTEEITEEGEAMAKRTRQLFAEAKKAKVMEDLTRTGHAPPEFIEQMVDGQQDEVLWARERGGTSAQAAAAQAGAGAADSEDCEETPEGVEAGQRRARADMAKMQVEEDLADAVREQRQAEAEAEAEARCAEAAAMSAEAALQRLKEDAEKAEAAALAARAKAKQTQEALSAIRENFVSKLASIAAAASGKLGEGDKSTGAPFDDLSKFRKESLDALKRNIFQ